MDHLAGLRAELGSYARDLAGGGQASLRIAERERFRLLCSLRYVATVWPAPPPEVSPPEPELTVAQQRATWADDIAAKMDKLRKAQEGDQRGPGWRLPSLPWLRLSSPRPPAALPPPVSTTALGSGRRGSKGHQAEALTPSDFGRLCSTVRVMPPKENAGNHQKPSAGVALLLRFHSPGVGDDPTPEGGVHATIL